MDRLGRSAGLDNAYRQIALPALVVLRIANREGEFLRLLEFLEQSGDCEPSERHKTFDALYGVCMQQSPDRSVLFLRDIVQKFFDLPAAHEQESPAISVLIVRHREFSYSQKYVDLLSARDSDFTLSDYEYIAVAHITSHYLQGGDIRELQSLDRLPSRLKTASAETLFGYVFACNCEMLRQERLGRVEEAISSAKELIALLEGPNEKLGSVTAEIRSANAKSILRRYEPKLRAVNPYKGKGRNTLVLFNIRTEDKLDLNSKPFNETSF